MKSQEERNKEREQQRIQDNMDRYYCPEEYYKRKARRKKFVEGLSEIFVQGIPYDNDY